MRSRRRRKSVDGDDGTPRGTGSASVSYLAIRFSDTRVIVNCFIGTPEVQERCSPSKQCDLANLGGYGRPPSSST